MTEKIKDDLKFKVAGRQGFEPQEAFTPQRFSRPPLSTAQPSPDYKICDYSQLCLKFAITTKNYSVFSLT